ncbi:hypothetical protein OF83DRAFT_1170678 [Amylostereum chailletii]|nr:hypothetical protein OF83DRAFT_1170678 [Amylostereum chailletii]
MSGKRYVVFIGAPPPRDPLPTNTPTYGWHIVSSDTKAISSPSSGIPFYPPATLEAVGHRISLLYQNIIFSDGHSQEDALAEEAGLWGTQQSGVRREMTTMLTWDATTQDPSVMRSSRRAADTFLRASPSRLQSMAESQYETQGTSYEYSDASSIARFPDFHFSLHSLTSLSNLRGTKGSRKISALLAVLEVDGPDRIKLKKGPEAGKEIYVLNMILGDEEDVVCKLTAWRDVAETWGGEGEATGVKRGDVVYFENVSAAWEPKNPITLTASPQARSKAEICFRTMPRASFPEDSRLRPDLRLGYSDATVRRVAAVVQWFQRMAGLAPT